MFYLHLLPWNGARAGRSWVLGPGVWGKRPLRLPGLTLHRHPSPAEGKGEEPGLWGPGRGLSGCWGSLHKETPGGLMSAKPRTPSNSHLKEWLTFPSLKLMPRKGLGGCAPSTLGPCMSQLPVVGQPLHGHSGWPGTCYSGSLVLGTGCWPHEASAYFKPEPHKCAYSPCRQSWRKWSWRLPSKNTSIHMGNDGHQFKAAVSGRFFRASPPPWRWCRWWELA